VVVSGVVVYFIKPDCEVGNRGRAEAVLLSCLSDAYPVPPTPTNRRQKRGTSDFPRVHYSSVTSKAEIQISFTFRGF
jgi:hypothetical protein